MEGMRSERRRVASPHPRTRLRVAALDPGGGRIPAADGRCGLDLYGAPHDPLQRNAPPRADWRADFATTGRGGGPAFAPGGDVRPHKVDSREREAHVARHVPIGLAVEVVHTRLGAVRVC